MVATNLTLDADAVTQATRLAVQCHRCGQYNSPEFQALSKPLTKVTGSLRIVGARDGNNAPWIDITDANVTLPDNERAHGGINGGLLTLRFSVPVDAATRARLTASGDNRVEFRFNGTDGNSNGFRILDLQLQDAGGRDLLSMPRTWADIGAEKTAGREASSADTAAGQALWSGSNLLRKSPIVDMKLRASCSSCHASDGRDLQYFNYSNHAIVQRSRFHGLTEAQGRQIVAYLRSTLFSKVPHVPQAAPWNPPYQPGPGLDARPIAEWAAGAGLGAVLPDAKAFVNVFTGKAANSTASVTQAQLDAAMDPGPGKVLNTREMPVPLQFPDWNAWLPIEHPLDIWTPEPGQAQGLFETQGNDGTNPIKVVKRIDDFLKANRNPNGAYGDWSHLNAELRERAQAWLNDVGSKTIDFAGGGRGSRVSGNPAQPFGGEIGGRKLQALMSSQTAATAGLPAAFTQEAFIERALFGVIRWMGVKQWELAHTHGLEGRQDWLHGTRNGNQWTGVGEARGWPFSWPSVFYMAPHILYVPANGRENYFSWEPRLVSFYRTNQWYQLQMTVNPGWPGASEGPMDWPYHLGFTTAVVDDLMAAKAPEAVSATHLARYFQVRTKLAQLANTDLPFNQPDPAAPTDLFRNKGHQSRASLAIHKLGVGEVVDRGPESWEKTRFRLLDSVTPGLHLMFVNSSISLYNTLYATTTYEQWRRCDPNVLFGSDPEPKSGFRFCLDAKRTPLPTTSQGKPHLVGGWVDWTGEQYITWSVLSARNHGAETQRLKTFSDWADRMWRE
ncbi:hypothetical protein A4W93_03225 [Piscinibacter gummiphilus]|uniref:Cytochrome c domain-containing protein n=1 Tax=Piscinibacter gummiphilus TaxID=946333 RepID=A0A1W6L498_9BURK|nr:hypothetical protein A4W93_03225 [Piscinibacter gummiphilus]ATU63653.1 hypothetical protein CPZ87_03300 [Piscinibacter gummiphilus]